MAFPITLISVGIAVFVISLGAALGFVPPLTEGIRDVLVEFAGTVSGVCLTIYGIWKVAPDPLKSVVAKGLRRIPNLPSYYKRRTIGFELESEINRALREFGKEGAGFVAHDVSVRWLTPREESRRLFFEGGKAYLKLDFDEDKERVLVEAVVMYCSDCLLPEVRQYVQRPLMRAVDLTFIDELLERRNAIRGRGYFTQEVMPREIEITPDISKYLDTLELLSQHGLFIRILLPELRDYPGRAHRRVAKRSHLEQIEGFMEFLRVTAEDRTTRVKRAWLHIGETIRTAVMLVGAVDRLQFEGTKPYVKRTAMNNADGARTVYLIGYNLGVDYVPLVAKEAKQRGIVDEYEIHAYDALIGGELRRQVLASLSIPEGSGRRFLDLFPGNEEWPDLEDEADTDTASSEDSGNARAVVREISITEACEREIDAEWSKRADEPGQSIHGSVAATDAAGVLGANRLSESPHRTLTDLLKASPYLRTRWSLEENWMVRLRCGQTEQ